MLDVREAPGKGRGLFATRDIKAGEVVLSEQPILLVVNQEYRTTYCCTCLRTAAGGQLCPVCGQAIFCSAACQQAAKSNPHVHSPDLCRALAGIAAAPLSLDEQNEARFLLHILVLRGLREQDPEQRYNKFLTLTEATQKEHIHTASKLHPFITNITGIQISVEELASLLSKGQLNSYGIIAAVNAEGERSLRGSGVYLQASFINHECAPTLARFDDFDSLHACSTQAQEGATRENGRELQVCFLHCRSEPPGNTAINFRALHDLPAGTELVQSYVPLGWDLKERQQHLQHVYGFMCNCPRCQTESSPEWNLEGSSDGEWETDSGEGAEEEEEEDMDEGTSGMEDEAKDVVASSSALTALPADPSKALDPTYLQLFLLKYICPRPYCGGTLAPVPGRELHECNVCGNTRTDQQFLSELEKQ